MPMITEAKVNYTPPVFSINQHLKLIYLFFLEKSNPAGEIR